MTQISPEQTPLDSSQPIERIEVTNPNGDIVVIDNVSKDPREISNIAKGVSLEAARNHYDQAVTAGKIGAVACLASVASAVVRAKNTLENTPVLNMIPTEKIAVVSGAVAALAGLRAVINRRRSSSWYSAAKQINKGQAEIIEES